MQMGIKTNIRKQTKKGTAFMALNSKKLTLLTRRQDKFTMVEGDVNGRSGLASTYKNNAGVSAGADYGLN